MIKVVEVSRNDFYHEQIPVLFHDRDLAQKYYFLSAPYKNICKCSTNSEMHPEVIEINNIIGIGCDLLVVFFDCNSNAVNKELLLSSYFYNFELTDQYLFIICEVEIIILTKQTFAEFKTLDFTEVIDHVELIERNMYVSFLDWSRQCIIL